MNLPVLIAYFVYTPRKRHPLMTSGTFSKCRLLAKAACRNVGLHSGMFVDLVSPSYIYSPANGGLQGKSTNSGFSSMPRLTTAGYIFTINHRISQGINLDTWWPTL